MGLSDQISTSAFYGSGITVIDLDKDGWDDVVVPRMNMPVVWYRNLGGTFERIELMDVSGDTKSVVFADADRDGDLDAAVGSRTDSHGYFMNNGSGTFTRMNSSGVNSPVLSGGYGCSWGDIDQNGYSDLYVCSYNALPNSLFMNQGDGTFVDEAEEYGVTNGAPVSNYCFQSNILDIDFDGDQDLHVINDREPIDALYVKTGSGMYSDEAAVRGLNGMIDSMSSSISDYDHDGDYDIYVTNTMLNGNCLFRDNGNLMYTNVSSLLGLSVHMLSWGALWVDVDNDTWDDLYVCTAGIIGSTNPVFRNQGGVFSLMTDFADFHPGYSSYAVAKGDFNRDGYSDLVVAAEGMPVQFYYNNGGNNHWLKVALQGVASNPDGYGAWIEYWVNQQRLIRYFRSGENYLSQNSQHEILGLGQWPVLDSMKIHWPSGQVDEYFQIPADHELVLIEGEPWSGVVVSSAESICQGQSVQLSFADATEVYWNNGTQGATSDVFEPGVYQVWWVGQDGLLQWSHPLELPLNSLDSVQVSITGPTCADTNDGSIAIVSDYNWTTAIWSTGVIGPVISGIGEGVFGFTGYTAQGCLYHHVAVIESPDPMGVEWTAQPASCFGGNDGLIEVTGVEGGTGPFSVEVTDEYGIVQSALAAGDWWLWVTDESGCVWMDTVQVYQPEQVSINLTTSQNQVLADVSGGIPPYDYFWNEESGSESGSNLINGVNTLVVTDAMGCTVEMTFDFTLVTISENEGSSPRLIPIHGIWHWTGSTPVASVRILDITGRLLVEENQPERITLSDAGVYLAQVVDESGKMFVFQIHSP
jgi:hypothetical protein